MDRNQNEETIHLELYEEELDLVVCGLEYGVRYGAELTDDGAKCVQDFIKKLKSHRRST